MFNNSLVVIPSDDRCDEDSGGPIFCLDTETGAIAWQRNIAGLSELGSGIITDLSIIGDQVIGVTSQDEVMNLNAWTGETVWSYRSNYDTTNDYWSSVPAITDSVAYFGGLDGVIRALSTRDGAVLWQTDIGARVSTSTVLHNGSVYIGAADSALYRLNLDGEVVGQLPLGAPPAYQMNATDDRVLVFTSGDGDFSGMANLLAVDESLDSVRWEVPADSGTLWSIKRPYLWRDYVLTGDGDGYVHLLESSTGMVAGRFHVRGEIRSLGFSGDIVYVGTINGLVHAVRASI